MYLAGVISLVMVCANPLLAQVNFKGSDGIKQLFVKNVSEEYQEKVFIHTDRDTYLSSESLWYSAFCVDAAFHRLSEVSVVLNIDLIDESGKAVKKQRIRINHGRGEGEIFVSPEWPTGRYRLRAYSSWMRNTNSAFFYHKEVTIINPTQGMVEKTNSKENTDYSVQISPEGGDLVVGLESVVAVKATTPSGEGWKTTLKIQDSQGQILDTLNTNLDGYGKFSFIPETGKSYSVCAYKDHQLRCFDMPKGKKEGLVMKVGPQVKGIRTIHLQSCFSEPRDLYFLVHTRGILKIIRAIRVEKHSKLSLNINELPAGITVLTVLSANMDPVAERLIFKYPEASDQIQLALDQSIYAPRSKVSLSISSGSPGFDHLFFGSVSVTRQDVASYDNIIAHLLLTSDVQGGIQHPWTYFDVKNKDKSEEMDLLMLTHGWRRFNWQDVKLSNEKKHEYLPEINAPLLSGHVKGLPNHRIPNSIQISFPGLSSYNTSASIDGNGRFIAEVPFRIQNQKVYFSVSNDSLMNDEVWLDPDFAPSAPQQSPRSWMLPESKPVWDHLYQNIQISQIYRNHSQINGKENRRPTPDYPFFGRPDLVFNLDDYTRFETMEDLFIEYINTIYIRKRNGKRTFLVAGNYPANGRPLVLVDGLPVHDFDAVMAMDPLKIQKIEVVTQSYILGDMVWSGLINFSSYDGNYISENIPEDVIEKAYQSLEAQRIFHSPSYDKDMAELAHIPDLRTTLFWKPNIEMDGGKGMNVEFFTGDDTGTYQVVINGISEGGTPVNIVTFFSVEDINN